MTPVWIAITSLSVAVVGLLITLVAHLIRHAYSMGQRDQRISALEARPHDTDCATQLASLTATLAAFKSETERRLDDLGQAIRDASHNSQPAPPARLRATK
jgi:hypothetical protein